jgi:hypothetical protein
MTARAVFTHHTRHGVLALVAFIALAVMHTWPLAGAPSQWSRVDNADASLNIWAVNWVGAHLFQEPSRLFDANIFHPEKLTLAYSEVMIVQGAIAAPIVMLGGSPVLAFNVALLTGLALTGWAFCVLVQRWTGSWAAGYVAGSVAAFTPQVLVRLGHLQIMHAEFFALMLFALDRLIVRRRFRDAIWLGLGFALQGLTSLYLLVFSVWMLLFALAARVRDWLRGGSSLLARLAVAAVVAAILLAPCLWAYQQLRSGSGLERGAEEQIAGTWTDYLATGARIHRWWMPANAAGSIAAAFPGAAVIVLTVFAFTRRDTRADARFRMCAIAAAGCIAVSMAPRLPFYPALHEAIPLFQAVRVPARLSQVVLILIAVLAGFGVAAARQRWPVARTWPIAAVLVLIVNLEILRAPVGFVRFEGVPGVYETLAADPNAVVVEVPFPIPQQWFLNGPYMVNSTKHWRPMLNGYSGFRPQSYDRSYDAAREFPEDNSLIKLHDLGVTHVIVHRQALGEDRVTAISRVQSLQEIASEGDIAIYRFRAP